MGLSVAAGIWLFVYTPAAAEIETSRAILVRLEKEADTLQAATQRAALLEEELAALSLKIKRLRIEERLKKRSPLYIMSALSQLAAAAGVEISPLRMREANPHWSRFEMTVQTRSFSSFGNYIESLLHSPLLWKIKSAVIKLGPEGRSLRVELVLDGYTG